MGSRFAAHNLITPVEDSRELLRTRGFRYGDRLAADMAIRKRHATRGNMDKRNLSPRSLTQTVMPVDRVTDLSKEMLIVQIVVQRCEDRVQWESKAPQRPRVITPFEPLNGSSYLI